MFQCAIALCTCRVVCVCGAVYCSLSQEECDAFLLNVYPSYQLDTNPFTCNSIFSRVSNRCKSFAKTNSNDTINKCKGHINNDLELQVCKNCCMGWVARIFCGVILRSIFVAIYLCAIFNCYIFFYLCSSLFFVAFINSHL